MARIVLNSWKDSLSEDQRKLLGQADALIAAQLKMVRSPWFRYFLSYDPRPVLAKVHCPVLALIGEKDRQVPVRENLSQIESTLKTAGNNRVTGRASGAQPPVPEVPDRALSEYAEIEQTIDASLRWPSLPAGSASRQDIRGKADRVDRRRSQRFEQASLPVGSSGTSFGSPQIPSSTRVN